MGREGLSEDGGVIRHQQRQPNPHTGGRETNNTAFVRSNVPRRRSRYLFFCSRIPSLKTEETRS